MPPADQTSSRATFVLRALAIGGLSLAAAGFALELLPDSRPGLHAMQISIIVVGALLALTGLLALRWRRTAADAAIGLVVKILLITVLTLLALEMVLAAAGYPTYFPLHVPQQFLEPAPWWTCESQGCHFVPEAMAEACQRDDISGRRCIVNRQGYHDTQDFVARPDLAAKGRILTLGDSFTFGLSADFGKSYVETIESLLPHAVVWNTGISNLGTMQALLAFERVAPIMKPQLTIYGFYVNDFEDNLWPVDGYFVGVDEAGETFAIQQYYVDPWGNITKLERQELLYYRAYGVEAPANALERLLGTTRVGSVFISAVDSAGKFLGIAQEARFRHQVELTREYLQALKSAAASQNSELLILLIPTKRDLSALGKLHLSAKSLFEELRIAYLNPIEALNVERDYAPDPDVHWNNTGHQKVGALLADCVESVLAGGALADCEHVVTP